MKDSLARDRERMPELLALASQYACGVVSSLDDRPVGVPPQKHPTIDFARKAIGAEGALQLFAESIAPHLSASAGPRHLGFVTGGATPAAVVGDWLTSVFDQNAIWNLHIDAAFGGFASLSPNLRQLLEGWEHADSICIDLHKWLNVPYDSAVAFTRHRGLQVDVFSNTSAYLGVPGLEPEPIHLVPENSHRWRALPAWFTLIAYGAEGHQEIVERNCRLAKDLGERIQLSTEFDLLAPVRLNVACFALSDPNLNDAFIAAVRNDGTAFVTPTVLRGTPAVRAAFSNWRTTADDLDRVWAALIRSAKAISLGT